MTQYSGYEQPPLPEPGHAPKRKGMPIWGWIVLGVVVVVILPCFGCFGFLVYVGSVTPEPTVYAGNRIPQRFLDTAADVGALEPGEDVRYFYSDAVLDIRDGFYFVSDRKVVVYIEGTQGNPLTVVEFDQIKEAELDRDESFFMDSMIYIELEDGTPVSFPVSSDQDGDVRFFEEIEDNYEPED